MAGALAARAAAQPTLHQPHTLIFFIATLLCLGIAVMPLPRRIGISGQRRVYWSAVAGAALCGFLASIPSWGVGVLIALFLSGGMVFTAYFNGRYIKIGGRVYAFHVADSGDESPSPDPAPDSYSGFATARKSWWLLVVVVGICSGSVAFTVVGTEKPWIAVVAAAVLALFAFAFGLVDASWGYALARGQNVQFGVIAVVSVGVFTVVYLCGYVIGKRWPWRPRTSTEYLAHPRFRGNGR